jgi:iron-sulfur cluster assembly accessory protein
MITVTERAAKAARRFIRGNDTPAKALRLAVTGGGCSGFQYEMKLENDPALGDTVVEAHGVQIHLDPASAQMLSGVTVDFVDTLAESGFTFHNPNASSTCGCGKSFSA